MSSRTNAVEAALPIFIQSLNDAIEHKGVAWIGIGTGSTIALFVEKLKPMISDEMKSKCFAIPTSFQAQQLIIDIGFHQSSLSQAPNYELDIAIDGADEVDATGKFLLKGGGGAHVLEKIIAKSSKLFVIIVDSDKVGASEELGHKWKRGIPLAILLEAYPLVSKACEDRSYSLMPRQSGGKIGPVISDQGHIIADLIPNGNEPFSDILELDRILSYQTGIVDHGLFCNIAHSIVVGTAEGSYKISFIKS